MSYQPPGYGYGAYYPPQRHPRATTALVLGILSLVVCGVLGPFAWVIGGKAVREIDASNGALGGRSEAMTGKILGIVATALLALSVLVLAGLLAILVIAAVSTNTDSGVGTSVLGTP